jgi:transcriptional regulator with XRE-family HTH domain
MITMNMIGRIRRLRFRDGLTISEICRKTGISRNTVKKWLNAADDTEPKHQRKAKPTLLTPDEERLKGWLET